MKTRPREFYWTKPEMVKDLIKLVPFKKGDLVLDAGSGANKVFYNNIPKECKRYECELESGCDFYKWDKKVDIILGNPPFYDGWKFLDKASQIANEGIAFLGNINFWNSTILP